MNNGAEHNDLKRFSRKRKTIPVIFIACEGDNVTEKRYFDSFPSYNHYHIKFVPCNETDPVSLADHLLKFTEEFCFSFKNGDRAYCIVDSDTHKSKNTQLLKASQMLNKEGFDLVVSYPCFELWILQHFVFTSKNYNSSKEVTDDVKKYIKDFDKNMNIYPLIIDNVDLAIQRCKTLGKLARECGRKPLTVDFSPYSEVYKVVEYLRNLIKSNN